MVSQYIRVLLSHTNNGKVPEVSSFSLLRGNIPGGNRFITGWLHALFSLLFLRFLYSYYTGIAASPCRKLKILECVVHCSPASAHSRLREIIENYWYK